MANTNVDYIHTNIPEGALLFLEPSCQSAFLDDYPSLVNTHLQDAATSIAQRAISAETWLLKQLKSKDLQWQNSEDSILLHGHCHQKSLWSTADTLNLLRLIPQAKVSEIESGCCGVAGSFGYEHYDISMTIANDRLLPAISANPTALIAANGTSCRAQINDAGHKVWHPIELISQTLIGQNS